MNHLGQPSKGHSPQLLGHQIKPIYSKTQAYGAEDTGITVCRYPSLNLGRGPKTKAPPRRGRNANLKTFERKEDPRGGTATTESTTPLTCPSHGAQNTQKALR